MLSFIYFVTLVTLVTCVLDHDCGARTSTFKENINDADNSFNYYFVPSTYNIAGKCTMLSDSSFMDVVNEKITCIGEHCADQITKHRSEVKGPRVNNPPSKPSNKTVKKHVNANKTVKKTAKKPVKKPVKKLANKTKVTKHKPTWRCEPGADCYVVSNIIPKNLPGLEGCPTNIAGNIIMSYSRWVDELGDIHLDERHVVYGDIYVSAYNAVYECCYADKKLSSVPLCNEIQYRWIASVVLIVCIVTSFAIVICSYIRRRIKDRLVTIDHNA